MRLFPRRALLTGASLATASALALSATAPALAAVNNDGSKTIPVATFTDLHGHLERVPNLAYQIEQIKAENPGDTIVASNGDSVGGSAYISSVQKDEPTIEALNAMGLQVSSAGNHEFDKGYKEDMAAGARLNKESKFPYLAANLTGADPEAIPPYTIIDTESGVKVGFIGTAPISSPKDISVDSFTNQGLAVTDPVAAVDKYAAQLKDGDESNGEADVVIALVHDDADIAAKVGKNVDAAVGGHSHRKAELATASGAPVIQPANFGQLLGRFDITVAADGKVSVKASMSEVADIEQTPDAPTEPKAMDIYSKAAAYAEKTNKTLAEIEGKALTARSSGAESTAVNMISDGFLAWGKDQKQGADLGYQNAGGTRADLDPNQDGKITVVESGTVQPFGNTLGTVEITGAQLIGLVEAQFGTDDSGKPRVKNAGFSRNLSYTYDPTAPEGSKVMDVRLDGKPVDPKSTYTVATTSYLLSSVFGEGKNRIDSTEVDLDAFNAWLQEVSPYKVDQGQRGIGFTSSADSFKAGDKVEISLSSLSMTADEDKPTEAIMFDEKGNELGRGPVDNTLDGNETGKATFTITIPNYTEAGSYVYTIKAGATTGYVVLAFDQSAVAPGTGNGTEEAPADGSGQDDSDGTSAPGDTEGVPAPSGDRGEGASGSTGTQGARVSSLPRTGAESLGVAGIAFAMVAVGGVLVARRRADRA
ncbi:Endonuclease YhcR precursor [Mycobacteroides abscessus subsp. abscessus]|nr:Endonuclease YhcR precursor [Mycobacteroides abscessus subsp. abscessus]